MKPPFLPNTKRFPASANSPTEVKGLDMSAIWNVWLSCVEPSSETVSKVFWPRFRMRVLANPFLANPFLANPFGSGCVCVSWWGPEMCAQTQKKSGPEGWGPKGGGATYFGQFLLWPVLLWQNCTLPKLHPSKTAPFQTPQVGHPNVTFKLHPQTTPSPTVP